MSLTTEWRERLDAWLKELPNHFYISLGRVDLEGFVTQRQLSREQAARGRFKPMSPGTKWGAKWEYGWFRGQVRIPARAAGRRVVFSGGPSGEMLVYVNGQRRRLDLRCVGRHPPGNQPDAARAGGQPVRDSDGGVCRARADALQHGPAAAGARRACRKRRRPSGRSARAHSASRTRRPGAVAGRADVAQAARSAAAGFTARWPRLTPGCAISRRLWTSRLPRGGDAPHLPRRAPEARAAAGLPQRLDRADLLRLRPRAPGRGLALAAGGDRPQGRAHVLQPARPDRGISRLQVPAEPAAPVLGWSSSGTRSFTSA